MADDDTEDFDTEHSDDDSPGIAAKKARLRAAADSVKKKPVAPPPTPAPAQQGAPTTPPVTNPDPNASVKTAMRKAQATGDTATLRRFAEHLRQMRKP